MQLHDFATLDYRGKLQVLNQSGKLQKLFTINEYQFSLYRVTDFYVELKRNLNELYFDTIVAMDYENLPSAYK